MAGIKSIASKAAKGKNPLSNELQKVEIIGYRKPYSEEIQKFKVQLNPNSAEESLTIEYEGEEGVPGSKDALTRFKKIPGKSFKLNLTIDGTGVTGQVGNGKKGLPGLIADKVEVKKEIELFKKATVDYDGISHDIPWVEIKWGGNKPFKGRLKTYKITHVLFKSNGDPLRSKIEAEFISATDLDKQEKEKSNSSPDLTHIRTVQIGDTLPLMCQSIYNNSSYYLKVAKFNNLIDFRNLEPGSEIIFPPIV